MEVVLIAIAAIVVVFLLFKTIGGRGARSS